MAQSGRPRQVMRLGSRHSSFRIRHSAVIRHRSFVILVLFLPALPAGCHPGPGAAKLTPKEADLIARIDASLASAARFMVARQSPDGAWRSPVYGIYKDGPSLTPHVISALYFLPQGGPKACEAFDAGVEYLVGLLDENGRVRADVELVYPIHTAAEASRLVVKGSRTPGHVKAHKAWLAYLREHQLNESLGWQESDLEYGGWSFAIRPPRRPEAGKPRGAWDWSNLSATIYGLAALRSAKVPADDPSFRQMLIFVQRCQNYSDDPAIADPNFDDGGFFFTPAEPIQNKAGVAGRDASGRQRYHSYGSMTVDGLRALLALGLPAAHPRVVAARRWLERNFTVEHNPGEFVPQNEWMRDAFYYYYCWGLAHAHMRLGARQVQAPQGKADWAVELAEALLRRQRQDGSWINRFTEAREDDPLVATPWASSVLAICRRVISGQESPSTPCLPDGRQIG